MCRRYFLFEPYNPLFSIDSSTQNDIDEIMLLKSESVDLLSNTSPEPFPYQRRTDKEDQDYRNAQIELENRKGSPITDELISTVNGLVLGIRRTKDNQTLYRVDVVRVKNLTRNICIYKSPKVRFIPLLMNNLMLWINKESISLSPVIQAAISHYELVKIHPFNDGNGRTARLLASFMLHSVGYSLRDCRTLENYFDGDRRRYREALKSGPKYHPRADSTKWIKYFCSSFLVCLKSR